MLNLTASFLSLSLGLVMASQVAPKLQIPVSIQGANDGATQFQVRCPFDFSDKHFAESGDVHGLERITRHPGLWSFGCIGLGQAMIANTIPLRIWWTGPAAVAWLGGWHTDSRFRRGLGGTIPPAFESQTSNIPFMALATGKQANGWQGLGNEIKPLNAAVGILMSSLWILRRVR